MNRSVSRIAQKPYHRRTKSERVEMRVLRKLAWALFSEGEFVALVQDGQLLVGEGCVDFDEREIELLREMRAHYEDRAWMVLRKAARTSGLTQHLSEEARRKGLSGDDQRAWVRDRVEEWIITELARNPWPWSDGLDGSLR